MIKIIHFITIVFVALNANANDLLKAKKGCYESQLNIVKYTQTGDLNLTLVKKRDSLISSLISEIPELKKLNTQMLRSYASHREFPNKKKLLTKFLEDLWKLELKLESIKDFKFKVRPEYIEWEIALIKYENEVKKILKEHPEKLEIFLHNLNILEKNRTKKNTLNI